MSAIAHDARQTVNRPDAAGRAHRTPAASDLPKIIGLARKAISKGAWLLRHASETFAEARTQKALLELELYHNHYWHTSKNDDDLPIDLSVQAEQPVPSVSRPNAGSRNEFRPSFRSMGAAWRRTARAGIAIAKRAIPFVLVLTIFATILAATIALRLAIWLPLYLH